jgi:MYXO-CTERM domain-containing protein
MNPMKSKIPSLFPLLAIAALAAPVCQGAVVFADDFSEPDGTAIIGKSPDVGSAWTGNAPGISGGSFDTTGAGRAAFGSFTTALTVGQTLTLTYDTLPVASNNSFSNGYAGVSLYVAGSEQVFTGDTGGGNFWGVDQPGVGGNHLSADNTAVTTATFTYAYDSGAWSFTTLSGVNLSGVGLPGEAFDQLRVANGAGGDIRVDNLSVNVTTVPEASSLGLLGLGAFGMLRRRR